MELKKRSKKFKLGCGRDSEVSTIQSPWGLFRMEIENYLERRVNMVMKKKKKKKKKRRKKKRRREDDDTWR
jgi:hypothetical protein